MLYLLIHAPCKTLATKFERSNGKNAYSMEEK